jgi:hypothetical protein
MPEVSGPPQALPWTSSGRAPVSWGSLSMPPLDSLTRAFCKRLQVPGHMVTIAKWITQKGHLDWIEASLLQHPASPSCDFVATAPTAATLRAAAVDLQQYSGKEPLWPSM